jgi:hypothetical protein
MMKAVVFLAIAAVALAEIAQVFARGSFLCLWSFSLYLRVFLQFLSL